MLLVVVVVQVRRYSWGLREILGPSVPQNSGGSGGGGGAIHRKVGSPLHANSSSGGGGGAGPQVFLGT